MGAFYTVSSRAWTRTTAMRCSSISNGDGDTGEDPDDRMMVGSPHPGLLGRPDQHPHVQGLRPPSVRAVQPGRRDLQRHPRLRRRRRVEPWRQQVCDTSCAGGSSRATSPTCRAPSWDGVSLRLHLVQPVDRGRLVRPAAGDHVRLSAARRGLPAWPTWPMRAIFVSGRNLKTWSDYLGFNPEANSAGSSRSRRSPTSSTRIRSRGRSRSASRARSDDVNPRPHQ